MGRLARHRPRRCPRHRRQSQRPRDAHLRGTPRGHGQLCRGAESFRLARNRQQRPRRRRRRDRAFRAARGALMRLSRRPILLAPIVFTLVLLAAPALRAEYVVLRSGQRLTVTGYQLIGDKYRLQMSGGFVEVPSADVVAIEPEERFTPIAVPVQAAALGQNVKFGEFIRSAATRFHVDADLISSVIAIESNFNPKAVSRRNARGLMQLIPGTATRLRGRNVFDPPGSIAAGTSALG